MRMDISDDRISAYLDDELPAAERAEVEAWLAESPAHRQLLAELAALRSDLHSLPQQTLGDDFAQRVVAAALARQTEAAAATKAAVTKAAATKAAANVSGNSTKVVPASHGRASRRLNSAWVAISVLAGAAIVAAVLIGRPWQPNNAGQPVAIAPAERPSHDGTTNAELSPAVAQLRQAVPPPGEALVVRVRVSQATLVSHGLDAALAQSGIQLAPADRAALASAVGNAYRQKLRETHPAAELATPASDALFIHAPLAQIESLLVALAKEPAANLALQPEMLVRAAPLAGQATAEAEGESGSATNRTGPAGATGPTAQRLNAGLFRLPKETLPPQRIESSAPAVPDSTPDSSADSKRPIQVLLIIEAGE